MCTLFVWYLAITFVTWQHTSGNNKVCVRICNSTWRTIYTYNNKYHSPKSNITTLHSVDCWIIYYLFSAAYPKREYNHNYMTLRFYCQVICCYHGIMGWHRVCWYDDMTSYCCRYHGMTYIPISSHRLGIKWHRCSFRIALVNLRGGDIITLPISSLHCI